MKGNKAKWRYEDSAEVTSVFAYLSAVPSFRGLQDLEAAGRQRRGEEREETTAEVKKGERSLIMREDKIR
jgi:hypothetical protein